MLSTVETGLYQDFKTLGGPMKKQWELDLHKILWLFSCLSGNLRNYNTVASYNSK